jgi:murein DD-endopeptidase MepM/ murein hydrolase activator NlpD
LDLCVYRTKKGEIRYFDEKIVVPVIHEGQVVRVIGDFLGESVFVSHGSFGNEGSQLYTIYGHLRPRRSIRPGETLGEHDIIGAIADPAVNGSTMPPHLHISMALIPDIRSSQELDWQIIGDLTDIILVDPLRVIELPYSVEAAL